ncbi:MAG: ABC transporter permease [Actinomycetes bacterium]
MNWLSQNLHIVWSLLLDHLWLSIVPIVLALVISIPLGWLAARYPRARTALLTGTGLLYAIPSLALFIMIPAIVGLSARSPWVAIIGLTLYGCALMVRGAADAFGSVSRETMLAADALGHSPWARFWAVELPLSGPVLVSSLRVMAVSTVSLVTIGAVIGISSLGTLFTDGFQRGIDASIITGIVLTVLVAFAIDAVVLLLGRLAMPWQAAVRA